MDAESERVDPAPRKVAYLAYAAQFKERLDLCRKAGVQAALAVGAAPQETARFLAEAQLLWNEPVEGFGPAETSLRVQGPTAVVASAGTASAKLADYRAVVHEAIVADDASREARVRTARAAYGPTYRAYLEFLHEASDVVGDDDVLRIGF
ncbi:hypothetical protein [Streptomyces sp. NBC_00893]|uniref:hypothetical protein n=1 Tax=Streptomyces sp. NBC_00893 TaxID=2975862 RepID=UPI002253CBC6|nr:hypothetical protein [Streptomyces sp. NBC_00893]MCX4847798.1 hypothetical protein [Streptomyces sp. NBC_00893]